MDRTISKKTSHSWMTYGAILIIFLVPYALINQLPLDRFIIPFLPGEALIPLIPWTLIIYFSAFVQIIIVIRMMNQETLKKALSLALGMMIIGLVIFLIIPLEYPRALYPSDNLFMELLRFIDKPGNCFPSLHVAESLFAAACYHLLSHETFKKVLMWIWSGLVIISVLTTKQHYVIDIIGGIILVIPFMILLKKRLRA